MIRKDGIFSILITASFYPEHYIFLSSYLSGEYITPTRVCLSTLKNIIHGTIENYHWSIAD